eukprot:4892941-Alexandrium_andersonii.AAC.1
MDQHATVATAGAGPSRYRDGTGGRGRGRSVPVCAAMQCACVYASWRCAVRYSHTQLCSFARACPGGWCIPGFLGWLPQGLGTHGKMSRSIRGRTVCPKKSWPALIRNPKTAQSFRAHAAGMFVELLLGMLWSGQKMTAKHACSLCWWASRAGAAEPIGRYAHRPTAPSGHFMRHLDRVCGTAAKTED